MITGKFPNLRLRRSRKNDWSRRLIEENNLTPNDFILPIFLIDGKNKKQAIGTSRIHLCSRIRQKRGFEVRINQITDITFDFQLCI